VASRDKGGMIFCGEVQRERRDFPFSICHFPFSFRHCSFRVSLVSIGAQLGILSLILFSNPQLDFVLEVEANGKWKMENGKSLLFLVFTHSASAQLRTVSSHPC
jgi:hypothetical protein